MPVREAYAWPQAWYSKPFALVALSNRPGPYVVKRGIFAALKGALVQAYPEKKEDSTLALAALSGGSSQATSQSPIAAGQPCAYPFAAAGDTIAIVSGSLGKGEVTFETDHVTFSDTPTRSGR
jgi:hypothetical protein